MRAIDKLINALDELAPPPFIPPAAPLTIVRLAEKVLVSTMPDMSLSNPKCVSTSFSPSLPLSPSLSLSLYLLLLLFSSTSLFLLYRVWITVVVDIMLTHPWSVQCEALKCLKHVAESASLEYANLVLDHLYHTLTEQHRIPVSWQLRLIATFCYHIVLFRKKTILTDSIKPL